MASDGQGWDRSLESHCPTRPPAHRMLGPNQGEGLYEPAGEDRNGAAEDLRLLTSELLDGQERERRRISQELHDELGQALLLIKLQCADIEEQLGPDQPRLKGNCQKMQDYLDSIMVNVRRLCRDLSPAPLEELGLSSALKYLVEVCSFQIKDYTVEIEALDHCLSPRAQINIYRICQEALTNIGKHAQASQISLCAQEVGDRVAFQLADNGQGFDLAEVRARPAERRGLGLASMAERVKLLGGSLQIRSRPGAGTRLAFSIPKGSEV